MLRKFVSLFIILLIVLLAGSSLFSGGEENEIEFANEDEQREYQCMIGKINNMTEDSEGKTIFRVWIDTPLNNSYTLYVPILLYNENISEVMDYLEVAEIDDLYPLRKYHEMGNATFLVESTEKGHVLKISGNGSCYLNTTEVVVAWGSLKNQNITLGINSTLKDFSNGHLCYSGQWWVYCNRTSDVELLFHMRCKTSDIDNNGLQKDVNIWKELSLENGWQLLEGQIYFADLTADTNPDDGNQDDDDDSSFLPSFSTPLLIAAAAAAVFMKKRHREK